MQLTLQWSQVHTVHASTMTRLTEFARTHNVVLSAWPAPGVERSAYLSVTRLAGLKAAVYLAQAARDCTHESVEVFDLMAQCLPRSAVGHRTSTWHRPRRSAKRSG